MVTSYDMIENEMGYCGSKSSAIALVKEQRVDGSYSFQVELLRYTLMASVMRYQPEILSNQNNKWRGSGKFYFSSVHDTNRPKLNKLHP